jgi:tetratricopeptide (TPR) repeat protein
MKAHFDLKITANYGTRIAEFFLRDSAGAQIGYQQTDFSAISVSQQRGLFDLRNYLRLFVDPGKERAAMAEIGVCIAEQVLGEEIFTALYHATSQRTLRIALPGASDTENLLAAALARVPWEIARPNVHSGTLGERNLLVRVVHDMQAPASTPIELKADEPLRVLFVFAESRGSRPLGARKERRELLRLFEKEIYPHRRVVAHFLAHGVTRERLAEQIQENGGYHIVHWSGHGNMNQLELCKPGGKGDLLTGQELLALFNQAGGFLPRLFYLSACYSGDILRVKDWNDFLSIAQGKEPGTKEPGIKESETKDLDLADQPGYTGTAHALLQGGVPSVVAMRYAVGDDYAREAAVEFYRALLAHAQPKNVAAALTMARQAMLDGKKHDSARFSVCDHATPILYGEEQPGITIAKGRSPALNPRNRRLPQIAELSTAGHEHFVGRTWELFGLGADFIGSSTGAEVKPVAVITGLGGMGKTALTAEALTLWESCFEWVLLFQAKPNRLEFDKTLSEIHRLLKGELKLYYEHVRANPADAIYREVTADFTGPVRLNRLTRNLLRALKDEPILIVLDNFETNLKPADPATTVSACQDEAWDDCLALLSKELVGSPSRVLITCRRPLAALAEGAAHPVQLGPLPSAEAALYLREQPTLGSMVFGSDDADKELAIRLLNASRFHPLLMDRLAKLAAHAPPRTQLLAALETLEKTKDFAKLPALFAVEPGDTKELAYLDDALATSLDQLIRDSSPEARRLLWIIAVANQPEALGLIKRVWGGDSHEQEQLRQIKQMLEMLPLLPAELQAKLLAMPLEVRAMLDALPPEGPAKPDLLPLLAQLVSVGLVTEEREDLDDANPDLTCHELVRERIRRWMEQHSQDRGEMTENTIRLAYAERLEAVFGGFLLQNMTAALQAGSRALVYCVQAGAWDRLGHFASSLVTSTNDPRLLGPLVEHLKTAAESAPEGRPRWRCLLNLADAIRQAGRPDASLSFYEQAAAEAKAVAEAGENDSRQAWSDLSAITGNWAAALFSAGDLDEARRRRLDSVKAAKKAGRPEIEVLGSELEALRILIEQGRAAAALPEVETRLVRIQEWWQQHLSGKPVPEAPEPVHLARALISALDIAKECHLVRKDWPACLRCMDDTLEAERALGRPVEEIASTRSNRASFLMRMPGRIDEAKAELEACLLLFEGDHAASATVLSSLADLLDTQGDIRQAIIQERRSLAMREQLPNPANRAASHNNLANNLERSGTMTDLAESSHHRLAALIYVLVAGLGESLKTSLGNYAICFRLARAAGTVLAVPRVEELLADPAFAPLAQRLSKREVPLNQLQSDVDQLLDQARLAGEST